MADDTTTGATGTAPVNNAGVATDPPLGGVLGAQDARLNADDTRFGADEANEASMLDRITALENANKNATDRIASLEAKSAAPGVDENSFSADEAARVRRALNRAVGEGNW